MEVLEPVKRALNVKLVKINLPTLRSESLSQKCCMSSQPSSPKSLDKSHQQLLIKTLLVALQYLSKTLISAIRVFKQMEHQAMINRWMRGMDLAMVKIVSTIRSYTRT
jgi:hypothetical protein